MVQSFNSKKSLKSKFLSLSNNYSIVWALLLLSTFFAFTSPYFLTKTNISNIFLQCSTIGIIAIGQGLLLTTGEVDLSLGMNVCFSCYIAGILMIWFNVAPYLAMIAAIFASCIFGLVGGTLVAYVGVPAFIATLGVKYICYGLAKGISRAASIAPLPSSINWLGRGNLMEIPIPVIIMVILYAIVAFISRKTVVGRNLYAIGGNKEAAFFAGINVKKYKFITFIIAGFFSGISAMVLLSRLGSASATNGTNYEFDAFIGCVLGGISMLGGKGRILQAMLGVLFLTIFFNGVTQLNVDALYQDALKGTVLVATMIMDVLRNRKAAV